LPGVPHCQFKGAIDSIDTVDKGGTSLPRRGKVAHVAPEEGMLEQTRYRRLRP